jgi:hypothetical protein
MRYFVEIFAFDANEMCADEYFPDIAAFIQERNQNFIKFGQALKSGFQYN